MAPDREVQHRIESGAWLVLTGAPNPDVTMVLVHEATGWRPVEGWAIFTNAASAELAS